VTSPAPSKFLALAAPRSINCRSADRPVALVTGAAKRVGAAISRRLHSLGYDLAIHYHSSAEVAADLCRELNRIRPDSSFIIQQDLSRPRAHDTLLRKFTRRSSRLDALINNASIFEETPLASPDTALWDEMHAINSRLPYFLSLAGAPMLSASEGVIINLLDIHHDRPRQDYAVYCASKSALASLTRSLALELAPAVRVNGVSPGAILWADSEPDKLRRSALRSTPLKRCGEPEDIAQAVEYLCAARYVTGQIINVDGGRSLNM